MSYQIPDLTGTNPSYYVGNAKYRVVAPNQKIELHDAVYADSLVISLEGTTITSSGFAKDLDWTINETDIDYTLMGQLQRLDSDFDKIVVKSITVVRPFSIPYNLNFAYQKVYPSEIAYIRNNPTKNVNFTPDVLGYMLGSLANLEMATAPIKDVTAATTKKPLLLEPDPDMQRPENFIAEESWNVDVPNSVSMIHPIAGAYFRNSLTVAYSNILDVHGEKQKLVEGTDYIVTGLDYWKTKHTSNPSGVYSFIVITTAYVGELTISYHAYGGEATVYDVRALAETCASFYKYVTDAQLLTESTLGATGPFMGLVDRVTTLETTMRRLATEGRPTYAEDQRSLLKRIQSPDTEFHWWTIGELYKVAGSDTVFTSEIAHIQIQTLYTKFLIDAFISIDLTNDYAKFRVDTTTALGPMGYIPYKDDSELESVIRPQFRIVWNANTRESSGIYLQLGMRLKTVANETVAVADLSGVESCFKLSKEIPDYTLPEDDTLLLPSGNHLWDSMNPDSRQNSQLIPMKYGHVIWAGSTPMNRPESGWREINLVHFLEKEVDINKISTVTCFLEEDSSNRFSVVVPCVSVENVLTGVATFSYANKAASIVFRGSRDPATDEIIAVVQTEITAGLSSNPLYLRYVVVNS